MCEFEEQELEQGLAYCAKCGHFQEPGEPCPPADEPCGSYLCCING